MKKIAIALLLVLFFTSACAPAGNQSTRSASTPTYLTPGTSTPETLPPSPEPATATPAVTLTELGLKDPALISAFNGAEKTITHQSDGSYSVPAISYKGETQVNANYKIDKTTFTNNPDIKNAYAPATVNAKDANGKQVTLIWNEQSGWIEKFNPSTNIEQPTDIPYEARIPILQSILLDHADPFTKRSNGLLVHSEKTDNGRVVYLRTDDASGTNSKVTDYWLRMKMPDGSFYYVNPTDINDLDGRKIMMCAYPKEYTNPTGGQNPGLDKGLRAMLVSYLKRIDAFNAPIWGIIQADSSFFDKFSFRSTNMPGNSASDLNHLLTDINLSSILPRIFTDRTHFSNPEDQNSVIETSTYVRTPDGKFVLGPTDNAIQEVIIPCSPQ